MSDDVRTADDDGGDNAYQTRCKEGPLHGSDEVSGLAHGPMGRESTGEKTGEERCAECREGREHTGHDHLDA